MEETKADTVGFSQKQRYSDSDSDSDSGSGSGSGSVSGRVIRRKTSRSHVPEVDEQEIDDLKYKDINHLTVLTYNKPEKLLEVLRRIFFKPGSNLYYDYIKHNNYPDIILLQEISDYITNDDKDIENMRIIIRTADHTPGDIIIPFELVICLKTKERGYENNILTLVYYGYYARVSKKHETLYKSLVTLIKISTKIEGKEAVVVEPVFEPVVKSKKRKIIDVPTTIDVPVPTTYTDSDIVISDTDVHRYCTYRKMCQDTDYTCTEGFGYGIGCYSGSDIQVNPTHVIRGVLIVPVVVGGKEINIANTHMTHNRTKQIFINYLDRLLFLNKSFIFGGDMNIDFNKENEKKEFNHYDFFTGLPGVKFHRTKTRTIGKTKEGSGSILDWFVTSCDIECKSIRKQLPATIATEDHYKVFANFKLDYEHNAGEYSSAREQIKKQIEALNSEEEEIRRFIQNYRKNTCLLDPTKTEIILQEYISNFKGADQLGKYTVEKLKEYCKEKYIQKCSSLNRDALIDFILKYQQEFIAFYKLCESSGSPSPSLSPPEESKAPTPGEPSRYQKLNDEYTVKKLRAYCKDLNIKCPGLKSDIINSIISKELMLESPSPPEEFSSSDVDMG
jgi:hypothetical protein